MEPKPEGQRQPPPGRALTAIGAASPDGRRVLVKLADEAEERRIVEFFRLYNWTAIACRDDLLQAMDDEDPILCITDEMDMLIPLSLLKGTEAVILAIMPPTGEHIRDAYTCGVDWVETSPLDFDRPNGLRAFAQVKG